MTLPFYKQWIEKVITKKHSANSITLAHNNIYVVPSLRGLYFLVFALLNFVIGINYQNNLILGVSYLMLMLQISSLFYGYFNLHGVKLELLDIRNNFCGNHNEAKFRVFSKKNVISLSVNSAEYDSDGLTECNLFEPTTGQVSALRLQKRGKYQGGKFKIHSCYPFGLVNVWSYLVSDKTFYVYPLPLKCPLDLHEVQDLGEDTELLAKRSDSLDEFSGLKSYQKGMNRNRISWRHFAKNHELLVKDYAGDNHGISLTLDYSLVEGSKETRLSKLCYQVLEADRLGHEFALKLPGFHIQASNGEKHVLACLESLSEC